VTFEDVKAWLDGHYLPPEYIDCATAVMLKILDGKCKMKPQEKEIMALLYEQTKTEKGMLLGDDIHLIISDALIHLDDTKRNSIYETRVLAETRISRPVMKAFKAMIRQQGLFIDNEEETAA